MLVFAASVVVVLGAPSWRAAQAARAAALPGAEACAFRLPDLDAQFVSLDQWRGKVVLLCIADPADDACAAYLPAIADLYRAYRGDDRVQPLTIVRTEAAPGTPEAVQIRHDLLAAGMDAPSLLDLTEEVARGYRADRGAALFVIDTSGTIRHRLDLPRGTGLDGSAPFADARRRIDALLGSGPRAAVPAGVPVLGAIRSGAGR